MKEKSKSQKQIPKNKVYLRLLHQKLGHRSTRSLLVVYAENVWQDIWIRVFPDPFCTSCQISTINKKPGSKSPLKTNTPFKWVFMDIISAKYSKSLTKYTTFDNYILIVDAYSKIPKLYGIENIITEEVIDKLDMFQARFGKVYEFSSWDMEIIQTDAGKQFTFKYFQGDLSVHGVQLALTAPDHQEMNARVEVTWRKLLITAHSIMVHAWVSKEYINFALMYMTDHIFPFLSIKHLVNQDVE